MPINAAKFDCVDFVFDFRKFNGAPNLPQGKCKGDETSQKVKSVKSS